VAQEIAPDARIVYIDNDPMVLAHARTLLSGTAHGVTAYVDADAHDPAGILRAAADTLDLDRPVGVLLLGILNFILDDDEAERVVSSLVAAIPSGSYVAITHPTLEVGGEGNREAIAHFNAHATPPITARSSEQVRRFFTDLQLLEPGVVPCSQWRPGDVEVGSVAPVPQLAGVGVKE
jgi:O-methyltransferase involved in polyketide biosynthesis